VALEEHDYADKIGRRGAANSSQSQSYGCELLLIQWDDNEPALGVANRLQAHASSGMATFHLSLPQTFSCVARCRSCSCSCEPPC
jgi:hypothetical protein